MPRVNATAAQAFSTDNLLKSCLIYGVTRAGKTVLCATFPRPVIITSAREGGYTSVLTMDPALRYEAAVEPLIYTVSTIAETFAAIKEVYPMIRAGRVKTVVLELTFYSDDVVKATTEDSSNKWAKYKLLDDHVQWLDATIRKSGARIVYNALAADAGDLATKAPAGIQVAGKALGRKLPASTDLTGYLHVEAGADNQTVRVLHLTAYGQFPAGHRYGSRFPPMIRNPSFRLLEDVFAGRVTLDGEGRPVDPNVKEDVATINNTARQSADDLPSLD